ncbi:MAG TPA: hypothetical protein EYQ43_02035 [Methyloprofundus sp.]|uniref:hypothetical protein n=1 Tax=Methyloprofundus sp. TaxID=2020875 RepID=UPI0017F35197|nr:hypothetical protein [Methyloprofundus sp.]HIG64356.1 hypothetical protein [Methyloprofundus sp.]HIL78929.1 hypothetical protein [Methylococcales bacterium]
MRHYNKNNIIKAILITSITSLVLVACGDQQKKTPTTKVPAQQYKQAKVLKGNVVDDKGPVRDATIKVADSRGRIIANTSLKDSNNYTLEIPAGTSLPIVITVKPKGSAEKLKAVVISTIVSRYDISPLTTKIANRAKELGGYTRAHMVMAADNTVGVPDANKTSTGFRGDPTKQYGGWH